MTFDKLKAGMVLYDAHSYRMGNTTIRTMGVWTVRVIEVNAQDRSILASWNSNAPAKMCESQWSKLRLKKPELVGSLMSGYRLAPRVRVQKAVAP